MYVYVCGSPLMYVYVCGSPLMYVCVCGSPLMYVCVWETSNVCVCGSPLMYVGVCMGVVAHCLGEEHIRILSVVLNLITH